MTQQLSIKSQKLRTSKKQGVWKLSKRLKFIFVLNKWDLRENKDNKAVKAAREWINIMFGQMDFAPILPLSAIEGKGVIELLNTTLTLYEQLTRKIDTSALNNGNLIIADGEENQKHYTE